MNERQKQIIVMALIYAVSNLDDIIETFHNHEDHNDTLSVNGDIIDTPSETELAELLMELQ